MTTPTTIPGPSPALDRVLDAELAYSPSFRKHYSSHLAMALVALHQLGAPPDALDSTLDAHARNELEPRDDRDVLDERIASEEQFFARLPDNMVEIARLQRDMQVNERLYLTISQQSAELAVWEQTQMGFGRVVDYAILPDRPVSPRVRLLLLIGFMLGGALAGGFILLRELSITQIKSVETLKEQAFPVLAVIPDIRPQVKKRYRGKPMVNIGSSTVSTDLVTLLDSISPASESYRRLQSNLLYAQPDKPNRVVCITSPNKSEGKSTVVTNLAVTLVEAGRTAVILDCDFRRPRVHRSYGLNKEPGLVEYLFDEQPLEAVLQSTVVTGVDVISAGKKTANPAAMAGSAKLSALIDELRSRYDFVLVDTPPFGIITDAAPLIPKTDGVVVAVRFNQTRVADFDQTIENLRGIRANILGSVMIGYNPKKATGHYYSSSYYRQAYTSYNAYIEDQD